MAEMIKKTPNQPMSTQPEWDPFRAMRDWLRWDPFREMIPMPQAFERTFSPSFDVTENKDAYVFKADVPGVKETDLEITTQGNRLQIAGKREYEHEEKTDTVYTYERQYGNFSRVFTLPEGADIALAKSDLKDGVLTVVVPKKPAAQAKKIEISSSKPKS